MANHPFTVSFAVAVGLFTAAPVGLAQGDGEAAAGFDAAEVVVEINATDGDIGFHALLDADGWREARIFDPSGKRLFEERAKGTLAVQGLTETAFESAEPLCAPDPQQPDAEVVPLSEFIERFPAGTYRFRGKTIENEAMEGSAELTHQFPSAPRILGFDGSTVTWEAGGDLGRCDASALVADGTIPDPANVMVAAWEVVVEPVDSEAVGPLRIYSVQLPAGAPTSVTVPPEFVDAYRAEGVTDFKVEIGALGTAGNRTFSEQEFGLEAAP